MSWTYSGDPTKSYLDAIRFLIGDVVEDEPLLSDEEIVYLYKSSSNRINRAAAEACEAIAASFMREADVAVGGMRVNLANKASQYLYLARILRQKTATDIPTGVTSKERDYLFSIGMFSKDSKAVKEG